MTELGPETGAGLEEEELNWFKVRVENLVDFEIADVSAAMAIFRTWLWCRANPKSIDIPEPTIVELVPTDPERILASRALIATYGTGPIIVADHRTTPLELQRLPDELRTPHGPRFNPVQPIRSVRKSGAA